MKAFLLKVFLFALLILAIHTILVFTIPAKYTSHRLIENVRARIQIFFPSTFYPNKKMVMNEVGDIGHHTSFQIDRPNSLWISDEKGFRNEKFIADPELVFIGHSFIYGAGLSQEQTVCAQFKEINSQIQSLNLAPSTFNQFLQHLRNGLIVKPKYLIYGSIERNIPEFKNINERDGLLAKLKYIPIIPKIFRFIDPIYKSNYQKYFSSRLSNSKGKGLKSPSSNMLFLQGKEVLNEVDYSKVEEYSKLVLSYSEKCKELGIEFIFVGIPNKETIYFDQVPLAFEPPFLSELNNALIENNVNTIDILNVLKQNKSKGLLYHLDDTHWNQKSTKLFAAELNSFLKR